MSKYSDLVLPASPGLWARELTAGKWRMAPHLGDLDRELVRLSEEHGRRLIVQWPPRFGKSTLCSVYFPAWYRLRYPERNIMLWSATGDLARRFSVHVRDLIQNYVKLDERTRHWAHWKLQGTAPAEGEFYAAGIGGGGTMGAGFHLGIIDDYHKNMEDALSETIRKKQQEWFLTGGPMTRAEPDSSFIMIATRWHVDDLIGYALRMADELGQTNWEVITKKALDDETGESLWPERWPTRVLQEKREAYRNRGYSWMWEALYQQRPPEILESEWDPRYFDPGRLYFTDWPERMEYKVAFLDPSLGKSERRDYSALVILGVGTDDVLYVDADIRRRDAAQQVLDTLRWCVDHSVLTLGVETNAFAEIMQGLFESACRKMNYPLHIHGVNSDRNKVVRIRAAVTPWLAQGRIRFKRHSPGTALLLEQLRGFPAVRFDDGPDALSSAIVLAGHVAQHGILGASHDELLVMA